MSESERNEEISPETLEMGQLDLEEMDGEDFRFDEPGGDEVTTEESSPEDGDELAQRVESLESAVSELGETVESTVGELTELVKKLAVNGDSTARQLNTVNENLHRENQRLKEGLYDTLVMPVLKDMTGFSGDILRNAQRYRKMGKEEIAEAIEDIVEDIHLILESNFVEVYVPEIGDTYEPLIHKIQETVETSDRSKDRLICGVKGYGYRYIKNEKPVILSPCRVSVYKYKKEDNENE